MPFSPSLNSNASICLRCHYRLFSCRKLRKKRQISATSTLFSNPFAVFAYLRREQPETEESSLYPEDLLDSSDYKPSLPRRAWKPVRLHSRHPIEVEALGETSEIFRMRQPWKAPTDRLNDKLEQTDEDPYVMSPSRMLATMDGERGLVNEQRISTNIEDIKSSWFSNLQIRSGVPTVSQYNDLVKSLQEGFTKDQLVHYFTVQSRDKPTQPSLMDLSRPFSTNLYTRSSWKIGSTQFPTNASSQLVALRDGQQQNFNAKQEKHTEPSKSFGVKRAIILKILGDLWKIQRCEELEMMGEMDIWMQKIHLRLILNHRSNMLKGLAQKYGVKLEAGLPLGVIRVSGDIGTCADIFRFLVYTLENIAVGVITLRPAKPTYEQHSKPNTRLWTQSWHSKQGHWFLNRSLREKLQKLTSTVISTQIPSQKSSQADNIHRMLRVYYLGSQHNDFEDIQRVLQYRNPPISPNYYDVVYEDCQKLLCMEPCPIDIGQAVSLMARDTRWSRWIIGTNRVLEAHNDSRSYVMPDQQKACAEKIGSKIFKNTDVPVTAIDPNVYSNTCWEKSSLLETAAVFGLALYPSDSAGSLKKSIDMGRIKNAEAPAFRDAMGSHREFLSTFAGLRTLVFRDLKSKEGNEYSQKSFQNLRIKLIPSQKVDESTERRWIFPDLELHLDIDESTKKTTLTDARLIIDRRHVDLLLPQEVADVRFLAGAYIPPANGQIDPQIHDFVNSSSLDIFGQGRLKTPKSLEISIPAHAVQPSPELIALQKHIRVLKPGRDISVNYAFSSLEHRSYISKRVGNSDLEYTIIESGQIGGRRIEARLVLQNSSKRRVDPEDFLTYFRNVTGFLGRFRESPYTTTSKNTPSDKNADAPERSQMEYRCDESDTGTSGFSNLRAADAMDRSRNARIIDSLPDRKNEEN